MIEHPDIPNKSDIVSILKENGVTLGDIHGKYNIRYFMGYSSLFVKLSNPHYQSYYRIHWNDKITVNHVMNK